MIYSIFTLKSYFLLEKYYIYIYIYIYINNNNNNNILLLLLLLLQGGGGTKHYRVAQVLLQYAAAFRY